MFDRSKLGSIIVPNNFFFAQNQHLQKPKQSFHFTEQKEERLILLEYITSYNLIILYQAQETTMPLFISVGCKVTCKIGPRAHYCDANGNRTDKYYYTPLEGTVLAAVGEHKWKVKFVDGKVREKTSKTLTVIAPPPNYEAPAQETAPAAASVRDAVVTAPALQGVPRLSNAASDTSISPVTAVATTVATAANKQVVPTTQEEETTVAASPIPAPLVLEQAATGHIEILPAAEDDVLDDAELDLEDDEIPLSMQPQSDDPEEFPEADGEQEAIPTISAPTANEEEVEVDEHQAKRIRSENEKKLLHGTSVTVHGMKWTVIGDSLVDPVPPGEEDPHAEYHFIGVRGFDFERFNQQERRIKKPKNKGPSTNIHGTPQQKQILSSLDYLYLELFMHLWPGNWKHQRHLWNTEIERRNELSRKSRPKRGNISATRPSPVKPVSEHEFWVFVGILIASSLHRENGHNLWVTEEQRIESGRRLHTAPPNFATYMPFGRFKAIKGSFPAAFATEDVAKRRPPGTEGHDPWWPVLGLIDAFNENRKHTVAASRVKTFDESMSGWQPRTTKTGGLPNISFIMRKPVPLGTEFKNVCCSVTGIMLYVEVQRGKDGMKKKHPSNGIYGATTGCTYRLSQASNKCGLHDKELKNRRELHYADSWFASVKSAELLSASGIEFCGPVKTNKKHFPKEFIETKMNSWASGMHLVLEGTSPNGSKLIAIGYKYNSKKVLSFVMTKGAGNTTEGKPYIARFTDKYGNINGRSVQRPEVLSKYYAQSNKVDMHNQSRQGDLRLERHWKTDDCWFRIITTFIGITVVDSWKAFRSARVLKGSERLPLKDFVNHLTWELLFNKFNKEKVNTPVQASYMSPMELLQTTIGGSQAGFDPKQHPVSRIGTRSSPTKVISPEDRPHTSPAENTRGWKRRFEIMEEHQLENQPKKPGTNIRKRNRCARGCGNLTSHKCVRCNLFFCKDKPGKRLCYSEHLEDFLNIIK